jgi:uncharacterized protein (TIGR02677 family)
LLAARFTAEAGQAAAARERLVSERPIRLSDLGQLDPGAFALFLALLGDALSGRRPDQREVRTTTGDGSLEVRLLAIPDAPLVEVRTDAGTFRGPDHLLHISDSTASARRLVA